MSHGSPNRSQAFEAGTVQRGSSGPSQPAPEFDPKPSWYTPLQRALWVGVAVGLILWVAGSANKGVGIPLNTVDPSLAADPVQTAVDERNFTFSYKDVTYEVQPVADYDLRGLVVSHNNPAGFGDIYHDERSVDTKDLCVIWGANVSHGGFHKVEFSSGAWTCYARWPGGVVFSGSHLSNNHLITDKQAVRDAIEDVRIGDQIHIRGKLVNYTDPAGWKGWWRKSSLTRTDAGNTACEVVFVDSIDTISRGTPGWYLADQAGLALLFLSLLTKVAAFLYTLRRT